MFDEIKTENMFSSSSMGQKTQVCISVGICGEKLNYQPVHGVGEYNLYMSVRKRLLEKGVFGDTQEFRLRSKRQGR
jgi:hypothetical protein